MVGGEAVARRGVDAAGRVSRDAVRVHLDANNDAAAGGRLRLADRRRRDARVQVEAHEEGDARLERLQLRAVGQRLLNRRDGWREVWLGEKEKKKRHEMNRF